MNSIGLNLRFRNMTDQPLILAYVSKSSVVIDNCGTRYYWGTAGTYDTSASGIGKIENNRADLQFALRPGEMRNATFHLIRDRTSRQPIGTAFNYDVSVAQLEILPSQQVRSARQYTLNFQNLAAAGPAAAPAAGSVSEATKTIRNVFKGLGKK